MPEQKQFIKGRQGGFDPATGRWRDRDGRFRTKSQVNTEPTYGQFVPIQTFAPQSKLAERFEQLIGGMDANELRAAEQSTDPMPSAILAMMRLSEFYCQTEGDVFQTIETPLDIALKPLEFQSGDNGFQKDLEELYSGANIDVFQNLYYMWLCSGIYGQAFPMVVWGSNPSDTRLVLIPPKNVEVGRSYTLTVKPPGGTGEWTKELLETAFPPMIYKRLVEDWNESAAQGYEVKLSPGTCLPIREKSLPFQRYAIPPLMRASRSISTRRIFEEMRRATVEGYKNQLWLFLLGDVEHRPMPTEMQALVSNVEGIGGERTGFLVWTGDLDVKVIAPNAPDTMMANDTYTGLTMDIFRKLGISLKVVSGERGPLGGGSARTGDMELDIGVLIERLKFKINQMLRWEQWFRAALAERMGPGAVKANEKTVVDFGRIGIEVQQEIRERLMPAYQTGALSIQSFLEGGGWDYQIELERKKAAEKDKELFAPPMTYAQTAMSRAPGVKQTTTQQTQPQGRPPNVGEDKPREPKERPGIESYIYAQATADFAAYVSAVYDLFDKMAADKNVPQFIESLKNANREYMYQFAVDGYQSVGGNFTADTEWVNGAISFVNSFADDFGNRLQSVIDNEDALQEKRLNAYLYPQEGRHLAYMYGVQQAMQEKGARAWRRILHPELSKVGPCQRCMDDSRLMHPITEPFFEFHPQGVCSVQGVAFYTAPTEIPVEVPIPQKIFDPMHIIEYLKRIGKALGAKVEQVVRRVRGD